MVKEATREYQPPGIYASCCVHDAGRNFQTLPPHDMARRHTPEIGEYLALVVQVQDHPYSREGLSAIEGLLQDQF